MLVIVGQSRGPFSLVGSVYFVVFCLFLPHIIMSLRSVDRVILPG